MSSAQQPAGQAGAPGGQSAPGAPPGAQSAPGAPPGVPAAVPRKPDLYRSPVAPVVWWVWVAFALANLVDIAVQGRDHFAAQIATVLVLITGVAYVAAFRPRVLADDAGITIKNPLRDHQVPWACVERVDLGNSLQVHCSWPDGTGGDGAVKTRRLDAWAVNSPRRSRLRAEIRAARRPGRTAARQPSGYGRMPEEARQAMARTDAENIAAALRQRAGSRAGAGGGLDARPVASWNWLAVTALVVPALLVVAVALA